METRLEARCEGGEERVGDERHGCKERASRNTVSQQDRERPDQVKVEVLSLTRNVKIRRIDVIPWRQPRISTDTRRRLRTATDTDVSASPRRPPSPGLVTPWKEDQPEFAKHIGVCDGKGSFDEREWEVARELRDVEAMRGFRRDVQTRMRRKDQRRPGQGRAADLRSFRHIPVPPSPHSFQTAYPSELSRHSQTLHHRHQARRQTRFQSFQILLRIPVPAALAAVCMVFVHMARFEVAWRRRHSLGSTVAMPYLEEAMKHQRSYHRDRHSMTLLLPRRRRVQGSKIACNPRPIAGSYQN